jgi:hypothetical protein
MREHLHELFYRNVKDGNVSLTRFSAQRVRDAEVRDDLINLCEGVAKDGKTLNPERDAIVYKVDGSTEFFVSRYFYLWPNYTDREDYHGKSSGKRQQGRDQRSRGHSRGQGRTQSRSA